MITADKARRKAITGKRKWERHKATREKKEIKKQIKRINRRIKESIEMGANQMPITMWVDNSIIESLRNRGFIVEVADGRWGNKYIVKWGGEQNG